MSLASGASSFRSMPARSPRAASSWPISSTLLAVRVCGRSMAARSPGCVHVLRVSRQREPRGSKPTALRRPIGSSSCLPICAIAARPSNSPCPGARSRSTKVASAKSPCVSTPTTPNDFPTPIPKTRSNSSPCGLLRSAEWRVLRFPLKSRSSADGSAAGHRRVYVDGQWQDVAAWRRDAIGSSLGIVGPAIVEEDYTAIYVAPGWSLALGRDGHLVAARSEELA